jgi:hypothetical protein
MMYSKCHLRMGCSEFYSYNFCFFIVLMNASHLPLPALLGCEAMSFFSRLLKMIIIY